MAHRGSHNPQDILRQGYLAKRSQTPNRFSPLTYQLRWFCLTKSSLAYFNSDSELLEWVWGGNLALLYAFGVGSLLSLLQIITCPYFQKQREKGRLPIGSLKWVEKADLGGEPQGTELRQTPLACLGFKGNQATAHNAGFQVGYSVEPKKTRVLYLKALDTVDRDLWIQSLRQCLSRKLGLFSFAGLTGKLPFCEETHFHRGLWGGSNQKWNCCGAHERTSIGCEPITLPLHPATSGRLLTQSKLSPSREGSLATLNSANGTLQNKIITPTEDFGSRNHIPDHSRENSIRSETDLNAFTPPMAGGAPGTPLKSREKQGTRRLVLALYPFKAIEPGDLSLEKGEEYEVVDDTQEHWWQVREKNGVMGYIPSNYVKEKELIGLQQWDWYVGDMSRQRAETLLRYDDKEGSFVVRNSSTKGLYTLSLYTKVPHPQVKHYHIKQNGRSEFFLSEKHCCPSIPDLVTYHRHNAGGLASRLKNAPTTERTAPPTAGLSHDKWEIDPSELMLHEELGSGQFGVVRRGKWRGSIDVAVKMMKEGTMSEDDFIEEAKVMTKLQHQNLVQLYGVCSKHRPIYIVTEYMKHGALLNFLRRHETSLQTNLGMLLDISIQVCKGMAYLERHNYIHRDLAARNCLVGGENIVKVADFGLARYVLDDQYTSSGGTKFPIKWAPPEVLNYTRFSSKSDIWAYGVLMWEVFTCGKMPYGRLKNTEVVERVQRGIVLEKPKNCPKETYEVMKKCWSLHPDERPSFRALKEELLHVTQLLIAD